MSIPWPVTAAQCVLATAQSSDDHEPPVLELSKHTHLFHPEQQRTLVTLTHHVGGQNVSCLGLARQWCREASIQVPV